jgi:hypothetical protein
MATPKRKSPGAKRPGGRGLKKRVKRIKASGVGNNKAWRLARKRQRMHKAKQAAKRQSKQKQGQISLPGRRHGPVTNTQGSPKDITLPVVPGRRTVEMAAIRGPVNTRRRSQMKSVMQSTNTAAKVDTGIKKAAGLQDHTRRMG